MGTYTESKYVQLKDKTKCVLDINSILYFSKSDVLANMQYKDYKDPDKFFISISLHRDSMHLLYMSQLTRDLDFGKLLKLLHVNTGD